MHINNSWKTALIALVTSASTIAAYKYIAGNDIIINEAGSGSNGSVMKLANFPAGTPGDFTFAASVSAPTVVHIKAKSQRQVRQGGGIFDLFGGGGGFDDEFFGGPRTQNQESSGSGVIMTSDGYIVTNNHVVEGSSELEVVTYNKKTYVATIIGTDPSTDIAVIKIEETKLPAITFSNSDEVKVGEWVLAVGNPFNLENTVTAGIVSAIGRNIDILGGNNRQRGFDSNTNTKQKDYPIESFIQTDAAVNQGNSGGALVNLQGNLIGINTAIASPNGAYAGYAFAVPSSIVKKVSTDIIKFGNVQRGFIGIAPDELSDKKAKEYDIKLEEGIYCAEVPDGGAAKDAGIKQGDVITKVDGVVTITEPKFRELIGRKRPGEKVILTVNRDGSVKDYTVTLKNNKGTEGIVKKETVTAGLSKLGVELDEVPNAEKEKYGLRNGVRISSIDQSGLISRTTQIQEGFVITSIDDAKVNTVKEAKAAIDKALKSQADGVLICGIYIEKPNRKYCTGVSFQ